MTAIGKLLVFVNVFLGVGLLAWGVSVYGNRVDYLDQTVDGASVPGKIKEAKAEIDKLTKAVADAQTGYADRRRKLEVAEARRDARQREFARRMTAARTGQVRVQLTEDSGAYGAGVMYDIRREGPVVTGPDGQPLDGLKVLQDKFADETRRIETLVKGKAPATADTWQAVRSGTTNLDQVAALQADLGINDLRELRLVLSDLIRLDDTALGKQRAVQSNLGEEAGFLADRRVNVAAELQTLDLRQRQLADRLKQLTTPR